MIPNIMRLEDRIVLDAAGLVDDLSSVTDSLDADSSDTSDSLADTLTDLADDGTLSDSDSDDDSDSDSASDDDSSSDASTADDALSTTDTDTDGVQVLVVCAELDDADDLVAAAQDDVIIVMYEATESLEELYAEIAEALDGQLADSIAFASHSETDGTFYMGGSAVDADALSDADMLAFWQNLSGLIAEDGRIDLLACNLASNDAGQELIAQLEAVTGRDVAASDDETGNVDDGGDWILEDGNINLVDIYFEEDELDAVDGTLAADTYFSVVNVIDGSIDNPSYMVVADINNDGYDDVVVASTINDTIYWYENDGSGNFTQHVITTDADGVTCIAVFDQDGDGDLEVVSANALDGQVIMYLNDGSWTENVITSSAPGVTALATADYNGDGDVDIIWSFSYEGYGTYVGGAINNGTYFTVQYSLVSTEVKKLTSMAVLDIDGDGDLDVAAVSYADQMIYLYQNDGTNTFSTFTALAGITGVGSVVAVDIDGDGLDELLYTSRADDEVGWVDYSGGSFVTYVISTTTESPMYAIAADVDGDGDMDIIVGSYQNDTVFWLDNDGGSYTEKIISTTADGVVSLGVGDFDGDGKLDIVYAQMNGDELGWYEQTTTAPATISIDNTDNGDASDGVTYIISEDWNGTSDVQIQITGSGFDASTTVYLAGVDVTSGITYVDSTTIICTISASLVGTLDVEVQNALGASATYVTIPDSTTTGTVTDDFSGTNVGDDDWEDFWDSVADAATYSGTLEWDATILEYNTYQEHYGGTGGSDWDVYNDGTTDWITNVSSFVDSTTDEYNAYFLMSNYRLTDGVVSFSFYFDSSNTDSDTSIYVVLRAQHSGGTTADSDPANDEDVIDDSADTTNVFDWDSYDLSELIYIGINPDGDSLVASAYSGDVIDNGNQMNANDWNGLDDKDGPIAISLEHQITTDTVYTMTVTLEGNIATVVISCASEGWTDTYELVLPDSALSGGEYGDEGFVGIMTWDSVAYVSDFSVSELTASTYTLNSVTTGNNAFGIDSSDGSVTLTGTDSLDYETSPEYTLLVDVGSTTGRVHIQITNVNEAPTSADNTVTTTEDVTYTFTSSDFSYTDVDTGDVLTTVRVNPVSGSDGILYYDADGDDTYDAGEEITSATDIAIADIENLQFVPDANETGSPYNAFTFQVIDSGGLASTSSYTMTINVTDVNDAPVATDNTVTTNEDVTLVFSSSDFTYTDTESDGLNAVQIVTTTSGAGTLFLDSDGDGVVDSGETITAGQIISAANLSLIKYIPATDDNGSPYDTFTFLVQDTGSPSSEWSAAAATMTINVTAVADNPTAASNTVTTAEDTAYTFASSDFGFGDVDGDTFTSLTVITLPADGTLYLNGTAVAANQVILVTDIDSGLLTFVPDTDEYGTSYASFLFKVTDSSGAQSTSSYQITIDVTSVADDPEGTDNELTINENDVLVFTAADFGYSDGDNDAFTSVVISNQAYSGAGTGTLYIDNDGSNTYTAGDTIISDGDTVSVSDITNGDLQFQPAAYKSGNDYYTFDFTVVDATGASDSTANTMTVDVTDINYAPVAGGGSVTTDEDVTYTFTVADFNYTDYDLDALDSVVVVSLPTDGILYLSGVAVTSGQTISAADIAAGNLTFVPDTDENGTPYASFTYQVSDSALLSSNATMVVNVNPVADDPEGTDNSVLFLENTVYTFTVSDFGYSDVDGDTFTSVVVSNFTYSGVGSGTLYIDVDGNNQYTAGTDTIINAGDTVLVSNISSGDLQFEPEANRSGNSYLTFDFSVVDSSGASDSTANTMTINITDVNYAPTTSDNTVSTNEDTTYTFALSDFDYNDVDGNPFYAVVVISLPSEGALYLSGVAVTAGQTILVADISSGNLTFVPDTDENGTPYTTFTFQVSDSMTTSGTSTMTVEVVAVADDPSGTDNELTINENDVLIFSESDFGFSDVDGDTFYSIIVNNQSYSGAGTGTLYIDNDGSNTYTAGDTIVANGDTVLVSVISSGDLQFAPAAYKSGDDYFTFDFTVVDSSGADDPSANSMTVDVTDINYAPVAGGGTVTTAEDVSYTFTVADFNYTDYDLDPLDSVVIVTLPTDGTLYLNGVAVTAGQTISASDISSGYLTFTPDTDENGTPYTNFTYTVSDSALSSGVATMTVNVTSVADDPQGTDNELTINENTVLTFAASDFGYSDGDGDTFDHIVISNMGYSGAGTGTLYLDLDGSGTYTAGDTVLANGDSVSASDIASGLLQFEPAAYKSGNDYFTFNFTVYDSTGASDPTANTMTVDVTDINYEPVTADNAVTTDEDVAYTFTTADFSYSDPDLDAMDAVVITTLPVEGTLYLSGVAVSAGQSISAADIAAGNLTFMPDTDEYSAAPTAYTTFTFQVSDSYTLSTAATMTVYVDPVDDAPTSADNAITMLQDTVYTFQASDFSYSDVEGDAMENIIITVTETKGDLLLDGVALSVNDTVTLADIVAGKLTYAPDAGEFGVDYTSFSFKVQETSSLNLSSINDYVMVINVTEQTVADDTEEDYTPGTVEDPTEDVDDDIVEPDDGVEDLPDVGDDDGDPFADDGIDDIPSDEIPDTTDSEDFPDEPADTETGTETETPDTGEVDQQQPVETVVDTTGTETQEPDETSALAEDVAESYTAPTVGYASEVDATQDMQDSLSSIQSKLDQLVELGTLTAEQASGYQTLRAASSLYEKYGDQLTTETIGYLTQVLKMMDRTINVDELIARMLDPTYASSLLAYTLPDSEGDVMLGPLVWGLNQAADKSIASNEALETATAILSGSESLTALQQQRIETQIQLLNEAKTDLRTALDQLLAKLLDHHLNDEDQATRDAILSALQSVEVQTGRLSEQVRILHAAVDMAARPFGSLPDFGDNGDELQSQIASDRELATELFDQAGGDADPLTLDALQTLLDSIRTNSAEFEQNTTVKGAVSEMVTESEKADEESSSQQDESPDPLEDIPIGLLMPSVGESADVIDAEDDLMAQTLYAS